MEFDKDVFFCRFSSTLRMTTFSKVWVRAMNVVISNSSKNSTIDLENADYFVHLAVQLPQNRLTTAETWYRRQFKPWWLGGALQSWEEPVHLPHLIKERRDYWRFYLWVVSGSGVLREEMSRGISKTRTNSTSGVDVTVASLWKAECIVTVLPVLLYGCEALPIWAQDIRRSDVRYPLLIQRSPFAKVTLENRLC